MINLLVVRIEIFYGSSPLISLLDSKIGRPFDILLIKDQNGNFHP